MAAKVPIGPRRFFERVAEAVQAEYDQAVAFSEETGDEAPLAYVAYRSTVFMGGDWVHTGGNVYVGYLAVPGNPDYVIAVGEEAVVLHKRNRALLRREGLDPDTDRPEEIAMGDPDGTMDRVIG